MKEYIAKFKEWYAALQPRERKMVNIGSGVVVVAIFYLGIWSSFLNRVDNLRTSMDKDLKTLAIMQGLDKQLQAVEGGGEARSALTPVALLALLQQQVKQAGIKDALSDLKQDTNDSIQMQFKNVSFDQLMKLLIDVIKNNRVTISQFSAQATATPGLVNASVAISLG